MGRVTAESASTSPTSLVRGRAGRVLLTTALLVLAWIGSGLQERTWPPTLALATGAAAVGIVSFRQRPSGPLATNLPLALRRSVTLWAVLVTAGLLWEAWAFFHQPTPTVSSYTHPTLSTLLDPVLQHRPVRCAGWLIWFGAGLRLVRL